MEHITVKDVLEATGGRLLCGSQKTPLRHVSIDSRTMKGDDLFVPLKGEKVDGHRFIRQAFENGAAASLTDGSASWEESAGGNRPQILVPDTRTALQAFGAWYRRRLSLPLIGITGSVGKTTTREMVACALSARFRVYKTSGNHNSQVGVPITLTELSGKDEIGVIELGMSEPGELTVIARLAAIQMAVITNIGVTHIQQLGSIENIYREKLSIQDGLSHGGILFLNGDDELLKETKAREGFRTVYYGTGENCEYRAQDSRLEDGYPVFTAVCKEERVPVRLKVMGSHNVANAMVSLAVAAACGIPMKEAALRLSEFTGFENRQQLYRVNGMVIIDDTYNASPDSMKAGIKVLRSVSDCKRRIAVLADMKELGSGAPGFHYEIGAFIAANPVHAVVLLGELAKEIGRGVRELAPDIPVYEFSDRTHLSGWLQMQIVEGDAVLFKGSNSMELFKVALPFIKASNLVEEAAAH